MKEIEEIVKRIKGERLLLRIDKQKIKKLSIECNIRKKKIRLLSYKLEEAIK